MTSMRYFTGFDEYRNYPHQAYYEIDCEGKLHRHVFLIRNSALFFPEDIYVNAILNVDKFAADKNYRELSASEYEEDWAKLKPLRKYVDRSEKYQISGYEVRRFESCKGVGWSKIPGFDDVYVSNCPAERMQSVMSQIFIGALSRQN